MSDLNEEVIEQEDECCSVEDRLAEIEARLANMEGVCKDGHAFQQGEDRLTSCIFCLRCGEIRMLCKDNTIKGFSQQ